MAQTKALLLTLLPADLSTIVLGYFQSTDRRPLAISEAGEYEACMDVPFARTSGCFGGACLGGHIEIVRLTIARGIKCWNYGLMQACEGGHTAIADLMIANGATKCAFNGCWHACYGVKHTVTRYPKYHYE